MGLRVGSIKLYLTESGPHYDPDKIIITRDSATMFLTAGPFQELAYLHELGHFLLDHRSPRLCSAFGVLANEAAAWRFALYTWRAGGRPLSISLREFVRRSFGSYVKKYGPRAKVRGLGERRR